MYVQLKSGTFSQLPNGADVIYESGELVDWQPDAEAQRMIDRGLAEAISPLRLAQLTASGKTLRHKGAAKKA
jgi:hypothetical protein